jgi:hypothetical protein
MLTPPSNCKNLPPSIDEAIVQLDLLAKIPDLKLTIREEKKLTNDNQ